MVSRDKMSEIRTSFVHLQRHVDARGSLSVAENDGSLPFVPARVFWISGVPEGAQRGGHAHRSCSEVVFAASGSFEIELDYGDCCEVFVVDQPDAGVVVPAGVWCDLRSFAENTVCVVLASEPYDAAGYIHDKDEWRASHNEK